MHDRDPTASEVVGEALGLKDSTHWDIVEKYMERGWEPASNVAVFQSPPQSQYKPYICKTLRTPNIIWEDCQSRKTLLKKLALLLTLRTIN